MTFPGWWTRSGSSRQRRACSNGHQPGRDLAARPGRRRQSGHAGRDPSRAGAETGHHDHDLRCRSPARVPASDRGGTTWTRRARRSRIRMSSMLVIASNSSLCLTIAISATLPGTTFGNHRADSCGHPGASAGRVSAGRSHRATLRPGAILTSFSPYKRGVTGSNPVAPTRS
jgi:hypothetical protein